MQRSIPTYTVQTRPTDRRHSSPAGCGPGRTEAKNRGEAKFQFSILLLATALAFAGCSDANGGGTGGTSGFVPNGNGGSPQPSAVSGGSSQSGSGATGCEPRGMTIPCHCPNGEMVGRQLCNAEGQLEPCSGCPAVSSRSVQPEVDTPLCPDIANLLECEPTSHFAEELPASILFVVDRSGSMVCNTPADGQTSQQCEDEPITMFPDLPTKWEITRDALKQVFDQLRGSNARAGLMFFSNDNYCGVHSDPLLGGVLVDRLDDAQVDRLKQTLDAVEPEGGTPLVGATILAYEHLHLEWAGDCGEPPCGAPGNRFVVLITDGEDSCPDPTFDNAPCGSNGVACTHYLLDTEVPKAVEVNIRTFVIGAPGSEPARGFLSELAFRGNTGKNDNNCVHDDRDGMSGDCHFDMTETRDFAADLSSALQNISGKALGCEFPLPEPLTVTDPREAPVNVQYTLAGQQPVCLTRDAPGTCESGANGWQFATDPEGNVDLSKIVLCGEACEIIENHTDARVDIVLGCTSLD